MNVAIKNIAPLRVASVRHTGPYQECGTAWNTLCAWAGPKGLMGPNTRFLGLGYDNPEITPPEAIRYDACITVAEDVEAEGQVKIMEAFGGDYAVCMHQGPYEGLMEVYNYLYGPWMAQSGREYAESPAIEEYLNDPNTTPPEELRTAIYVPLK